MPFECCALLSRIRHWAQYLRWTPFDVSAEIGRSQERHRRVALTAAAGVAARVLSAAVVFVSIPLTIGYLGGERYGLWLTVSSAVAMMSFVDLGIGNGLLTKIAQADGRRERERIGVLVSSSFFLLGAVALILSAAMLALAPHVDWGMALGATSAAVRAEARPVVVTLALVYFVAMPFAIVQRVQSGLQSGYASTLWIMGGTIASLVALLVATANEAGLVQLVLALSGAPVVVMVANFFWYFWRTDRRARPRLSSFAWPESVALLRTGGLYVVLQLAVAFAYVSDNLVIARVLGAEEVPEYAVPAKLFSLLTLPVGLVVGPLWPAYGEAKARGDSAWILRSLRRSVVLGVAITSLGGVALVAVGPWLIRHWTRGVVEAGLDVLVPLAVWTVLSTWGMAVAAFLNGIDRVREQAACAVVMAAAAFALKWLLVPLMGPGGAAWATVLAYFVFAFLPLTWVVKRVTRQLASGDSAASAP